MVATLKESQVEGNAPVGFVVYYIGELGVCISVICLIGIQMQLRNNDRFR